MNKKVTLQKLNVMFSVAAVTGDLDDAEALALAIRAVNRMPEDYEDFNTVDCKFCGLPVAAKTAHLHQGEYVGNDCCWDDRLKVTE